MKSQAESTPVFERIVQLTDKLIADVLAAITGAPWVPCPDCGAPCLPEKDTVAIGRVSPPRMEAGLVRAIGHRRRRRSSTELDNMVQQIVTVLRRHPEGLGAESIRDKLGVHAKELPQPIRHALKARLIRRTGLARATTYFAV